MKQEQSETILSSLRSVVVSGENCFSLSLSLEGGMAFSPQGRKKEGRIQRPRFVNFARRWNKE